MIAGFILVCAGLIALPLYPPVGATVMLVGNVLTLLEVVRASPRDPRAAEVKAVLAEGHPLADAELDGQA